MGIQALGVCLLGLTLHIVWRLVQGKKKPPLPPGPPGWPLIGNLFHVPIHAPHKMMGAMSQKYGKYTHGPIMSLNMMGMRLIVLNSPEVARDLLEKSGAITSNRFQFTMACELVGWGNSMPFLQYGDMYRKQRKFFHQQIGTNNSLEAFYPAEERELKRFLCSVLKDPDDLIAHAHRMAVAVILRISHGYIVKENDDPFVEMISKVAEDLVALVTPGWALLFDVLPILRYLPEWFPGGGLHKSARRSREMLSEAVAAPYEFVLEHLANGNAVTSFISRALQSGVTPEEANILKWASFIMYLGGSETTPAMISASFLAMTIYPDIFKKAQAEVDAIVGSDRLPRFEDRDALPYVNAICMELLRWHPAVPSATHVSTQDIIYEGYLIPKGSLLFGNIWSILSDPNIYPNPDVFDPERFLGNEQQLDPRDVCFGWGRRSCPGALLSEMTIFMCVAMALATLDVSRCVENGVECVPSHDATEGPVRCVKPFKCRVVPRSKQAEDLLQT